MSKKKERQKMNTNPEPVVKKIMLKEYQKNLLIFTAVFLILLIVLSPMAFKGLRPGGVDVIGSKGASHQRIEHEKETGKTAFWNAPVFSGMPIYHRLGGKVFSFDTLLRKTLARIFYLNIWLYLLGFIGMFFLLRGFKLNYWAAVFGAFGFMFIPHFMSLLSIGHFQKFRPIMYMPLVTFFFISLLNKRNLIWLVGFIFAFSVQIRTLHFQVVFYQILVLLFIGIYYLIGILKKGEFKQFLIKIIFIIAASAVIILMVAQPLFVVQEYTPYSIRGGTGEKGTTGLTIDYATGWSLDPAAILCWTMPRFLGGISGEEYNGSKVPQLQGRQIPGYWGKMPFTQTYDYIGIILLFMAVVGLIFNFRNNLIKVLSGLFLLSLLLAFGRHFSAFYNLFFNYIPFFNKFRVPAMIQVILYLIIIIFAGFGFHSILKKKRPLFLRKIIIGATVLFLLLGLVPQILSNNFSYTKDSDKDYKPEVISLFKNARKDMMQTDGWRLILFTLLISAVSFLFITNKIDKKIFITLAFVLLIFDQIPYVKRAEGELTDPSQKEKNHFKQTATDKVLLRDDSYFRLFPITENPFNTNDWSYYHNSIGGYSGAKLRIYQDIIENCIFKGKDPSLPVNWNILKMLNTKYLVSSQKLPEKRISQYYEDKRAKLLLYKMKEEVKPAWFVNEIKVVPERNDRFAALNDPALDVYRTAILEEKPDFTLQQPDSTSVKVIAAGFDKIEYEVYCDHPGLLVFAEIYYPAANSWKCYVDKAEKEIFKTDHILRSIYVDSAGAHRIIMEFKPRTFLKFYNLSLVAHLIALISLLVIGFLNIRRAKMKEIPEL